MKRKNRQTFGVILFIVLLIASYLVTVEPWKKKSGLPDTKPGNVSITWKGLKEGYPESETTDTIISYSGFDLGYNEKYEQASWVAYVLTKEEVLYGTVDRTDNFRSDPHIRTGSASLEDYRGSGYDRGHLAPAGDMKWSDTAMSESFLLSNISPQTPSFNRGIWKKLEEQTRSWAIEKDSIFIITGPLLDSINTLIGINGVGIPAYFFKVLVDLSPPDQSMIAFLIPNRSSDQEISHYMISVDSLEEVTGYDFFARAPDPLVIDYLESQLPEGSWK